MKNVVLVALFANHGPARRPHGVFETNGILLGEWCEFEPVGLAKQIARDGLEQRIALRSVWSERAPSEGEPVGQRLKPVWGACQWHGGARLAVFREGNERLFEQRIPFGAVEWPAREVREALQFGNRLVIADRDNHPVSLARKR